jgi:N-acylneuraminate cytidylyltransferase
MNNIIIIPARGGSKRLLNKNRLILNGKPLLSHSIHYAKMHSGLIDRIIVTTDDKNIENIALKEGVSVVKRPSVISGDMSSTVSALKHVLQTLDEDYDNVILLQPTNPLRPKKLLEEAYRKYKKGNYDSLMTVSRNTDKLGKIVNDTFIPFNYTMGQRSQDLEPLYYENGLLYISKTSLILDDKILGNQNYPFIVAHPYAKVDIDTQEDFKYAEFILNQYPNE